MGRDKALLPYRGTTLVEHVAAAVREAAGNVALIGAPDRYRGLGYPVYGDRFPGCGPLGGIYTALSISASDWNLVVACDMPGIAAGMLRKLLESACESERDCVMAIGPGGEPEPLCAVYHRRSLAMLEEAIRAGRFRLRDLARELGAVTWSAEPALLANVNTPEEWARFEAK